MSAACCFNDLNISGGILSTLSIIPCFTAPFLIRVLFQSFLLPVHFAECCLPLPNEDIIGIQEKVISLYSKTIDMKGYQKN